MDIEPTENDRTMKKTATPEKQQEATQPTTTPQNNSQPKRSAQPGRAISDPKEVAQLVMMRIDQVNAQKDELTIAVKALADTAKQLVGAYSGQQAQIARLAQRVEELEKQHAKG